MHAPCAQDEPNNELVIRIQPDEAVYLKMNNKVPGLGVKIDTSRLDLSYKVGAADIRRFQAL